MAELFVKVGLGDFDGDDVVIKDSNGNDARILLSGTELIGLSRLIKIKIIQQRSNVC